MENCEEAAVFGTWYPIETAPKDGRKVLLHTVPWAEPLIGTFHIRLDEWVGQNQKPYHYQPTHWMPLPEPPKE